MNIIVNNLLNTAYKITLNKTKVDDYLLFNIMLYVILLYTLYSLTLLRIFSLRKGFTKLIIVSTRGETFITCTSFNLTG